MNRGCFILLSTSSIEIMYVSDIKNTSKGRFPLTFPSAH